MNTHELTRELQTTVEQLQDKCNELTRQMDLLLCALKVSLAYLPVGSRQYDRTRAAIAACENKGETK